MQNRSNEKEEDVVMDDEAALDVLVCKQCVNSGRLTLFCSERCASENITRHRQNEHQTKTEAGEASGWVTSLSTVIESVLHRENPGLRMEMM